MLNRLPTCSGTLACSVLPRSVIGLSLVTASASRAPQWRPTGAWNANPVSKLNAFTPMATAPACVSTRRRMDNVNGRRDHDAFLSQYDPLEVLLITESDATIEKVKEQYQLLQAKHAPDGPMPHPKQRERVLKAFEILMDSRSSYYSKARPGDDVRQKLLLQLLPPWQRILLKAQTWGMIALTFFFVASVLYHTMYPVKKAIRSATRSL